MPGRHKNRRPQHRVGNGTPMPGEGVPGRRKRPSTTRLRDLRKTFLLRYSDDTLSRRCHFQDVQYHYFRLSVSVGTVNVYKVEAQVNRGRSMSRSWQLLLSLTRPKSTLLCASKQRPFVADSLFHASVERNALICQSKVLPPSGFESLRGHRGANDHSIKRYGRLNRLRGPLG